LEIEKDFLKLGRDSKGLLASTVVVAGLIYGYGENILSCIFKDAWQGQQIPLIVPGDGKNHVPMIHARDLCQVVQNICDSKPISRYIIAVDQGNESLSKVRTFFPLCHCILYIKKLSKN
jgi:adenylate kinase